MIPAADAIARLAQVAGRVDPRLALDRGNVRYVADPYPGVEFGLRLGEAAALLFMPEGDLTASDWEARLFRKLEAARRYLEGFPHRRPGEAPRHPEARRAPADRRL